MIFLVSCGSDQNETAVHEETIVSVDTAAVQPALTEHVLPAQVTSDHSANLSTTLMGIITEVRVSVGERVIRGDTLVRIKDDNILAQRSQIKANKVEARANVKNTKKNLNRIRNLYAEESATSKELDDISTMYDIARANMDALEARLNEVDEMLAYTTIRAPFSGIISRKYVSEGDMASPGHPLITVSDPESVKIKGTVSGNLISELEEGDIISVSVAAAGILNTSAKLTAISQAGDPLSRQFAVEAVIMDSGLREMPKIGMFAQMHMNIDQTKRLLIPQNAIIERGQLTGVYTLDNNSRAVLRWVRTGRQTDDMVEILSGLKPGETYVQTPGTAVRQGRQLTVR